MTPADVTYCVFRQLVICNMGFLILSRLKPKVIPQQLPAYEIKGKELFMWWKTRSNECLGIINDIFAFSSWLHIPYWTWRISIAGDII